MNGSTSLVTTLTLLLLAAQNKGRDEFEYEVHEVIHRLTDIQGMSDPCKADLYAMLVETVAADDRMLDIERKVEIAIARNRKRFPHG
jgi:hypothetical protein